MVDDATLLKRLGEVLAAADLANTTERQIRKQLEEEFDCDLKERKTLIRKEVVKYLESQPQQEEDEEQPCEEEEEDEEPAPKKKKAKGGLQAPCLLSPALAAFLGEEKIARSQCVKRIWEYIKANDLQNPKDKRKIIIDDKLGTIFKPPLTMFGMNKQLSQHMWSASDVAGHSESDDDDIDKPKKRKRKSGGGGGGGGGGFAKKQQLSEELAKFVGAKELARSELTKFFWAYFKENNLQDPSNKRMIVPDDALSKLLGISEPFAGFGIQKLLGPHIL